MPNRKIEEVCKAMESLRYRFAIGQHSEKEGFATNIRIWGLNAIDIIFQCEFEGESYFLGINPGTIDYMFPDSLPGRRWTKKPLRQLGV